MRNPQPIRTRNPNQQHHRQRPKNHNNGPKNTKTRHKKGNGETRTMLIQIDSREQSRIDSAKKYYTKQGHKVEVAELPIGDYVFDQQVAFELKTIPDFISSIQSGRVFNQAISQAEEFPYHYVIIVGNEHTRTKCLAMSRNYRPVTVFQYLGAIASLNRYTTVIESYSPYIEETYYRMQITAKKALSDKPIVKKFPRKHKNPALNFLMYSVYGINHKKAQLIVDTYDLKSLTDLMKLTKEDLTKIEGIGPKTATNIIGAIHGSQD